MREVQASELKEYLPQVLSDVEQGATVLITREGKPIARVIPENAKAESADAKPNFVEKLEAFRRELPATGVTIEEILAWRHEGHKY